MGRHAPGGARGHSETQTSDCPRVDSGKPGDPEELGVWPSQPQHKQDNSIHGDLIHFCWALQGISRFLCIIALGPKDQDLHVVFLSSTWLCPGSNSLYLEQYGLGSSPSILSACICYEPTLLFIKCGLFSVEQIRLSHSTPVSIPSPTALQEAPVNSSVHQGELGSLVASYLG